jgi:Na+/H+ antiporter NhaC
MRPVTDKYKVSREKLAFIVHGTAASVTSLAFISTWIGAELGYINDATSSLGISERTYSLFIHSLQYAFYPVLMLFFIFFLIVLKKDFGPMNAAEVEARSVGIVKENKMNENEEIQEDLKMIEHSSTGKFSWLTAFFPIITFIIVAFAGLIITGAKLAYEHLIQYHILIPEYTFQVVWDNIHKLQSHHKEGFFYKLGVLINYSDFYIPLLWSSFTGITVAIFLSVIKKGISLRTTMANLLHGFRIMLSAVIILVFAWALAQVVEDLHTTDYIASLISSEILFPQLLPAIVFILSALFSFATGSVWGTMAILYPLIIPVSWTLSLRAGLPMDSAQKILYMILASIITGSVFGNHCSPISDTTTVSSISSNCDMVAHIRTQVPYALVVATISLFLLIISQADLHWSINYLIGIILVFLIVKYNGKAVE